MPVELSAGVRAWRKGKVVVLLVCETKTYISRRFGSVLSPSQWYKVILGWISVSPLAGKSSSSYSLMNVKLKLKVDL